MSLLEDFHKNKGLIQVLSDSQALFLLGFLNKLERSTFEQLLAELGWSSDELLNVWRRLKESRLVFTAPLPGAKASCIFVTAEGERVLKLCGLWEQRRTVANSNEAPVRPRDQVVTRRRHESGELGQRTHRKMNPFAVAVISAFFHTALGALCIILVTIALVTARVDLSEKIVLLCFYSLFGYVSLGFWLGWAGALVYNRISARRKVRVGPTGPADREYSVGNEEEDSSYGREAVG